MKAPRENESDGPCAPGASEADRRARGWNWTSRLAASRVEAFAAVSAHLRQLGLSAPEVLAVDEGAGVAVVEDLGGGVFAFLLPNEPDEEVPLYALAGELLASLHAAPVPAALPAPGGAWPLLDFDRLALTVNAGLFVEWVPQLLGRAAYDASVADDYARITGAIIEEIVAHPRALTLRDYHAENLIWLPHRSGLGQIGLLDFQDAVHGYRAWDFTMLLHDARRDVSPAAHEAALAAYVAATGADRAALERELALQGAINVLRIIGIFARLIHRDHKDKYRRFMPRMVGHLRSVLREPMLAELSAWIARHAPLGELMEVGRG
jgi:N-acetylmuramate 1-kinase